MLSRVDKTGSDGIAAALVAWFQKDARDYPWRRTRDPYAILVSEIMLQQTQIPTVLGRGHYSRWLGLFPDFQKLAAAREEEVLQAWEGLGYYRRALNLHRIAKYVLEKHGGVFPHDHGTILAFPGIGPYTAGAVSSFAFGLPEPIVDGNIARVLSRIYDDATPVDSATGKKLLWQRARQLVEATHDPRSLNSALMELGQTFCTPANPGCMACPVRLHCQTREPEALPVKKPRQKTSKVTERVIFLQTSTGVLLEQENGRRRTGLWKLPALPSRFESSLPPTLLRTSYGITHYQVTLWVHEAPAHEQQWPGSHRIISYQEIGSVPMSTPYRRALRDLLQSPELRLET